MARVVSDAMLGGAKTMTLGVLDAQCPPFRGGTRNMLRIAGAAGIVTRCVEV